MLFTGDINGVVAAWNMTDLVKNQQALRKPKHFMTDHNEQIISIDSNYELDLYASASKHSCILRIISTNRYFLEIIPELVFAIKYKIFKIVFSFRGYLIIQARTAYETLEKDMLIVYSINGEKVAQLEVEESLNSILFDPTNYFIVLLSHN